MWGLSVLFKKKELSSFFFLPAGLRPHCVLQYDPGTFEYPFDNGQQGWFLCMDRTGLCMALSSQPCCKPSPPRVEAGQMLENTWGDMCIFSKGLYLDLQGPKLIYYFGSPKTQVFFCGSSCVNICTIEISHEFPLKSFFHLLLCELMVLGWKAFFFENYLPSQCFSPRGVLNSGWVFFCSVGPFCLILAVGLHSLSTEAGCASDVSH